MRCWAVVALLDAIQGGRGRSTAGDASGPGSIERLAADREAPNAMPGFGPASTTPARPDRANRAGLPPAPLTGHKRDERRASPPAFVTASSLLTRLSGAQCRTALRRRQVDPRRDGKRGCRKSQRVGSFRLAVPTPPSPRGHPLRQAPATPSHTTAGHMAPGLREPRRYGCWDPKRTLCACSPNPR